MTETRTERGKKSARQKCKENNTHAHMHTRIHREDANDRRAETRTERESKRHRLKSLGWRAVVAPVSVELWEAGLPCGPSSPSLPLSAAGCLAAPADAAARASSGKSASTAGTSLSRLTALPGSTNTTAADAIPSSFLLPPSLFRLLSGFF